MKKFFAITVILLSMMTFVACGGSKKEKVDPTDEPTSEEPTSEEPTSEEPTSEEPTIEPDEDGCTGISIDFSSLTMYYEGNFYYAGEDPMLYLEFYQEGNDNGFDVTEGTYDLGSEANSNYSTCTECISILKGYVEDEEGSGSYEKRFFQKSGTLTIEMIDQKGQITGTLAAKLIEVTINTENYESTPVEGGECLEIESATFDSGVCVPHCEEGWECGNDGCGGTCGGGCDGKACSADHKCVAFACSRLPVSEFELVTEDSLFGTSYYYDAYTTGNGIGSESIPDLLEIGFQAEELKTGIVDLTGDTNNVGDAYIILYEDWDTEEYTAAKRYFQESGTLEFTEVKEGTMESKGTGSFRLVEVDTDFIPVAGGKCYEFKNLEWDTICIPKCKGKQCGDDGCGGTCGTCEDQACSAEFQCVPFNCTEITLDTEAGTVNSYGFYETSYTPFTGEEEVEDIFEIELYEEDFAGTHNLANTNYKDCDVCLLVREDNYAKNYFQQKGTITFEIQESAAGTNVTAQISDLRLEEVSINSKDFTSIPVAGGACLDVKDATITYTVE